MRGVGDPHVPDLDELAQELGSDRDRLLAAVADRTGCRVFLRGNEITVEGDDASLAQARILVEELGTLVEQGLTSGRRRSTR